MIMKKEGGITLVIHAMTYHYQHKILMKLCLSVVANMAFNSAQNISSLVSAGAIDCIELLCKTTRMMDPFLNCVWLHF